MKRIIITPFVTAVRDVPQLPTLRELTARLRDVHEVFGHPNAGGEYVCLELSDGDWADPVWSLEVSHPDAYGREFVPGAPKHFDAVAAARRILAAARDAGYR